MTPVKVRMSGKMFSTYTPSVLVENSLTHLELLLIQALPRLLLIPWEDEFESHLDRLLKRNSKL